MNCDCCGFDMGDGPGPSGKCLGCGTPLAPSADQQKPGPGFSVRETEDPYVVTDADREKYDDLEGVDVIREKNIQWGRGIGAETHGYYIKRLEEIVDLRVWNHFDAPDECPNCGDTRAVHEYGYDGCVASYDKLTCVVCDHEIFEHFDC